MSALATHIRKVAQATCYGHGAELRPFPGIEPFGVRNRYPKDKGNSFVLLILGDAVVFAHFDLNLLFFT
jgi:hypothetical protein